MSSVKYQSANCSGWTLSGTGSKRKRVKKLVLGNEVAAIGNNGDIMAGEGALVKGK